MKHKAIVTKPPRWVVCAANRDRATGRIVCGARHYDDVMLAILFPNRKKPKGWKGCDQGFIDQKGKFLTREQAWRIAKKNGQIRYYDSWDGGTLYSENLY